MSRKLSLAERTTLFWNSVDKSEGCWLWKGRLDVSGYGRFRFNNTDQKAHRVLFFLDGKNLNREELIDHKCRNRRCVNPEHLRIVVRATNVLENSLAVTAIHNQKTKCINGHPFTKTIKTKHAARFRICQECRNAWSRNYRWKQKQAATK